MNSEILTKKGYRRPSIFSLGGLWQKKLISTLFCACASLSSYSASEATVYDQEKGEYFTYKAVKLDDVSGYSTHEENLEFSKYGGWKAAGRQEATGHFRTEMIDGRWWVIDPEGYRYFHKAVNSVRLYDGFDADDVYSLLPTYGLNGLANWSDLDIQDSDKKHETPLAHCPKYSFARGYGRTRADRLQIAVFDEEFPEFCQKKAEFFAQYKDDSNVFGYFIDNELSWTYVYGLNSHLALNDPADKNYQKATEFLESRGKTASNYNDKDSDDYAVLMLERYLSVVVPAIKAVDPNHMILGPRFNKSWMRTQEFMEVAGKYLDIVALNHYHRWGSRSNELENIAKWSGKPLLFSEFYAMEKIPGVDEDGAGWKVKDQKSRGLFFHNFMVSQLQKPFIVGMHWFNFQDYGANAETGASAIKRGIIDVDGNLYKELQSEMKYVNDRVYDYIDFVDSRDKPHLTIGAEADASYVGVSNKGAEPVLYARDSYASYIRRLYLRFNLAEVKGEVVSAKVKLYSTSPAEKLSGKHQVEFVADNSWGEYEVTRRNRPVGTKTLLSFQHGDDLEIDVTKEVLDALHADKKISLSVFTETKDVLLEYGAREHPDEYARPKLEITYEPTSISTRVFEEDFEDGLGHWVSSGFDAFYYKDGTHAYEGSGAALIRDDTGKARIISPLMELSGYDSVTMDFCYKPVGMRKGHDFDLQLSTDGGSTYSTVKSWAYGVDFENDKLYQATFTTEGVSLTDHMVFRFKADGADNSNQVYIDQTVVTANPKGGDIHQMASWTMTEVSDNLLLDSSGKGNNAIISGGAEFSQQERPVMSLDGENDYITLPQRVFDSLDDAVTISMWVKGNSESIKATSILNVANSNGKRLFNIHLPWVNRRVYWDAGCEGSSYDRVWVAAPVAAFQKQWNHWVFTKDKTKGRMSIYFNGQRIATQTGKTKPLRGASRACYLSMPSRPQKATLGMVEIYKVALTPVEIQALYEDQK